MALTYLNLQDAVLGRRFPASTQRENAKRWLETAYYDVWSAADWTFKRVSFVNLAVTSGDPTPTMPSDYLDTIELYDSSGVRLERLSQERFEREYGDVLVGGSVGSPSVYTVVDRQIILAPAPQTATFRHSYWRRVSHKNSSGAVVAGPLSADTDTPLWDDHQAVLIPRAVAIGLIELNDPTWQEAQGEYERQLSRMREDYEQRQPAYQWGKEWWG